MSTLLIVGHRFHYAPGPESIYERGFYRALELAFERVTIRFVEDGWPKSIREIPDYQSYDACMFFVLFRLLIRQTGFDWADYRGLRLQYDMDGHANFHPMLAPVYAGSFPEVFHRLGFRHLVCIGKRTRDAFEDVGVPSVWLPKAYDSERVWDQHLERHGLCHYGHFYPARVAMLRYLRRRRIPYEHFWCEHSELSEYLNRYLGCLICNMGAKHRDVISRVVSRLLPGRGIGLVPGFEPMLKNFEASGAGCAPIMDWIPELQDLGFEDGETMITYSSFSELADKLQHYLRREDAMVAIGRRASELVRGRHTWHHRAEELKSFIARY